MSGCATCWATIASFPELYTIFNNYVILFVGPEAFGTYIEVLLSQEPKGIWQWPINWFTSPMMVNKINRLQLEKKRFETIVYKQTNQNLI